MIKISVTNKNKGKVGKQMEALRESVYTQEVALADRVNEILEELKMTKTELGLHIKIHRSTITQYLNGKYVSNVTEVEEKLMEFIREYEIDTASKTGMSKTSGVSSTVASIRPKMECLETNDYINTIGLCKSCQEKVTLGIVIAKSGYGKTYTLKKYAKMPRVIYIVGSETMNSKDIIRRIDVVQ